ncbi:glycosyltransferase family 2 protein [Acidicapsa dinghuensis]|uniref:Glycosyltransferase family 2 protein n=1 Tax=Acidicapsa dinghuensis TaxID=2218256 RepID=A0ABW1EC81_9BACT|nr:glycosyltransferase family 2 protein [Acidicapsa dinghuensis]
MFDTESIASTDIAAPRPGYPDRAALFDISIVIVSFNTRDVLRQSLQTVVQETGNLKIEVFVVDNNSRDGSVEMVHSEFPFVLALSSAVNLGFGAANNLALKQARGKYIVLLNSDAFLRPDALRLAFQHMENAPKVGLAGGRLMSRDSSWQPSARMFPSLRSDFLAMSGLAHRFRDSRFFGYSDRTWADPTEPAQVDWVPGAFSIIRADALRQVGFFDPDFFLYSEEVDLCRRIKNAGFNIMYWPDIEIIHIGGESSRQMNSFEMSHVGAQLTRWRMRSTLLYYRKHHGSTAWRAKMLELLLYKLIALRNSFSSSQESKDKVQINRKLSRLMLQAWQDTNGGRISPPRPWTLD